MTNNESEYSVLENCQVKDAKKQAYEAADEACPPMNGMTQAEFEVEWLIAFDGKMKELGWEYTGDHCLCKDPDRGHEPACGWSKVKEIAVDERVSAVEAEIREIEGLVAFANDPTNALRMLAERRAELAALKKTARGR
jgi:hypothetical protein